MKEKTCCFTGHRKIPNKKINEIKEKLKVELTNLINKGVIYYGVGGALGFDTLVSQVILNLKDNYPQIRLILVLPCLEQTKYWDRNDIKIYEDIKSKADKCVYISKEYTKDCMLKRNKHLVDCSSVCICYLTRNTGGTAYTVSYAKQKGLYIINIAN